jgi:hypothetical protein
MIGGFGSRAVDDDSEVLPDASSRNLVLPLLSILYSNRLIPPEADRISSLKLPLSIGL